MRFSVRLLNTFFLAPVLSISCLSAAQAITFHGRTSPPEISGTRFPIEAQSHLGSARDADQNHRDTVSLEGIVQNLTMDFLQFSDRDRLAAYFEYRPPSDAADIALKLNLEDIQATAPVSPQPDSPSLFTNIDLTFEALAVSHLNHKVMPSAIPTDVAPGGSRNWLDAEESRYW